MSDDQNHENLEPVIDEKSTSRLGEELNRLLQSLGSPNLDAVSGVFGSSDIVLPKNVVSSSLDRG